MDVQADIGHVVKVFAAHQPDDLADLPLGIMAGQPPNFSSKPDTALHCGSG
jgi:hypothetical protein